MSIATVEPNDTRLLKNIAAALQRQHSLRYFDVDPDGLGLGWTLTLQKVQTLSPQTLGRLVSADPKAEEHILDYSVVSGWLSKAKNSPSMLHRLAVLALISELQDLCGGLPVFDHNCAQCIYLGSMQRQESELIEAPIHYPRILVDLYACKTHGGGLTIVVRHGSVVTDCVISPETGDWQADLHLAEGARRVLNRGLLAA